MGSRVARRMILIRGTMQTENIRQPLAIARDPAIPGSLETAYRSDVVGVDLRDQPIRAYLVIEHPPCAAFQHRRRQPSTARYRRHVDAYPPLRDVTGHVVPHGADHFGPKLGDEQMTTGVGEPSLEPLVMVRPRNEVVGRGHGSCHRVIAPFPDSARVFVDRGSQFDAHWWMV